jgi:hypothetical protein
MMENRTRTERPNRDPDLEPLPRNADVAPPQQGGGGCQKVEANQQVTSARAFFLPKSGQTED